MYPQQVQDEDEYGNLPLHIACRRTCGYNLKEDHLNFDCYEEESPACSCYCPCFWNDCRIPNYDMNPTELMSILDPLLEQYPEAASIPNKDGRLPLHLAIECGRSWYNGVKILYRAAPDVIRSQDPLTGLYPFQLALTSKKCDLTTAYQLLHADPSLVGSAIPTDEELVAGIRKRKRQSILNEERCKKKRRVDGDQDLPKRTFVDNVLFYGIALPLQVWIAYLYILRFIP